MRKTRLTQSGLIVRPGLAAKNPYALFREGRQKLFVENAILLVDQALGLGGNTLELLEGGKAVRTTRRDAERDLLTQTRDTDLEELVQVRTRDRQEPQTLQERGVFVPRLLEHATVELQK